MKIKIIKRKYNLITYLSSITLGISIIYFIIYIIDRDFLVLPTMISLLTLIIILFNFLFIKHFDLMFYKIIFFYHSLTLILPIIFLQLLYTPKQIETYLNSLAISEQDLVLVGIFVLLYDIILFGSIILFSTINHIIKKPKNIYSIYIFNNHIFILFLIISVSFLAKYYLITTGAWFIFLNIDVTNLPFISYSRVLEKLDIIIYIYIAYKIKKKKINKFYIFILFIFLPVSILLAIISGSKAKVFMLLFPLILIIVYGKNKIYLFITLLVLFSLPNFFEFMMYNRLHNDNSLIKNLQSYKATSHKNNNASEIDSNAVLKRLNYQVVLSKVFQVYPLVPSSLKTDYLNNILGLIPRLLWKNKPIIGIDTNQVGYDLGLISKGDTTTSVGLTPIGEAYYELGIAGIVVVPIFVGLFLVILSNLFNEDYWIGFLLSIMLGLSIGVSDSFNTLLPTTIQLSLIFYIFALLLSGKFSNEKRLRFRI